MCQLSSLAAMVVAKLLHQLVVFFFQAEDGIRDFHVTGVQTCALPIFIAPDSSPARCPTAGRSMRGRSSNNGSGRRSEERRVGKECRSRWGPDHQRKQRRSDTPHWSHAVNRQNEVYVKTRHGNSQTATL